MPSASLHLPEPLRSFRDSAEDETVAAALRAVETAHAVYREEKRAGRILANSVEALRVELTYHSNAIEGNTLTLGEIQLVLEGYAPPGGKPLREIDEARNHDRALRTLERWAEERPTAPLTERDLLDVHAQILADIDEANAGRFRSGRVLIKGSRFVPPGPHRFDELIPTLLELAGESGAAPALRAAELHYNLVAVHPFADGNGRTARLAMNHHLLRHGLPLAVVEVTKRAEYLATLEAANNGRIAPFAAFILGCVERSARRLVGEDS